MPAAESTQVRHTNTQERDSVRATNLRPALTHFQPTSELLYLKTPTRVLPENSLFIDNYHLFSRMLRLSYSCLFDHLSVSPQTVVTSLTQLRGLCGLPSQLSGLF